jgi:hypothetical protein
MTLDKTNHWYILQKRVNKKTINLQWMVSTTHFWEVIWGETIVDPTGPYLI